LVSFGDRPAPVPTDIVDGLQRSIQPDGSVRVEEFYRQGDRIELSSGPFTGVVGVFDRLEGAARVRLLLDLLGGTVTYVTHAGNITAAC